MIDEGFKLLSSLVITSKNSTPKSIFFIITLFINILITKTLF